MVHPLHAYLAYPSVLSGKFAPKMGQEIKPASHQLVIECSSVASKDIACSLEHSPHRLVNAGLMEYVFAAPATICTKN